MRTWKNRKITGALLRKMRACKEQVAMFEEAFPDGGKITRGNLLRAADAGLDVDWLAMYLLPGVAAYNYLVATKAAWSNCEDARKEARGNFRAAHNAAQRNFQAACATALWQSLNTKGD